MSIFANVNQFSSFNNKIRNLIYKVKISNLFYPTGKFIGM